MINRQFFDELNGKVQAILPQAGEFGEDLRTKVALTLKTSLDLLSAEEFEGQTQALARAHQRIDQLEVQLAELEQLCNKLKQ
ncbi:MAG: hypothetical protein COC19_01255 [SAR86 cluster bacterium]|uniref:Ubiquinone biosynthesis accessory factor UbiK n=1 Tax=SAR86 cluster bacterium TaxID=2030880 RepID=A0A2A4MTR2_9GAMM|nr:MAG: hypothetical protein COC19_01255 [SAR86 cluster bacterium]